MPSKPMRPNASYFLAAAAVTGGTVTLENLGSDSIQGDIRFADVLEQMGCTVTRGPALTLTGPATLSAIDADMEAIPDTAQTLAVVCAFADGPSRLTNLGSLRVKETDRVAAMAKELPKLGVDVDEGPDHWTITPPADGAYTEAAIDTYDDHRMAMAFARRRPARPPANQRPRLRRQDISRLLGALERSVLWKE